LQENKIRRIGAKDTIDINVKIIAALNKDPMKAIEDKELRMDLYYRLSVLNITIPPLRERKDDISVLVNYFVAKYNELLEKNVRYISSDICQTFQTYDWPGNIREIEHIVAFGMSVIRPDQEKLEFSDLERKWIEITGKKKHKTELPAKDLKTMVEEYEKSVIEKVLEVSAHNITKASLILKIPRQTLQRKIKQYEL
jgi:arginine utilization regulatory protein